MAWQIALWILAVSFAVGTVHCLVRDVARLVMRRRARRSAKPCGNCGYVRAAHSGIGESCPGGDVGDWFVETHAVGGGLR